MPQFNRMSLVVASLRDLQLVPLESKNGVFVWKDSTAATPALAPNLSVSLVRPSKTSKLYKVRMKGDIPVAKKDTSGQNTTAVDYSVGFDITFIAPEQSKTEDRLALNQYLNAVLTQFVDVIQGLESVY